MIWGTYKAQGYVEVRPIDEEHESDGPCPCDPKIEVLTSRSCGHEGCGSLLVVHNSFREKGE